MARVGLDRLEYLVERLDRAVDMEGSDVTVNTLLSDLGVTITAGGLIVTAGTTYLKGTDGIVRYQGAPEALADDTAAITAAMIKKGICTLTPGAARSKPTDTGPLLCAGLGLGADGDSFDFSIINSSATGGRDITLTNAASGVTLVGNPIVAARSDDDDAISVGVGRFRVRRTGAGVVVIYRIG